MLFIYCAQGSRACLLQVDMGKCINCYTYIWYSQKHSGAAAACVFTTRWALWAWEPKVRCGDVGLSVYKVTHFPGNDSHAEDEACARDTNNIKEINTSGYPQFIKLYTVCFSFSFGPRNQKRMKWWSMLAGIEGKSLSNSEKNLMRISKLNIIGRTFKEGSKVFSFSSDAEQFWKMLMASGKKD